MNTIQVTGVRNLADAPSLIEIDEFVPLRFRTYNEPLGSAYLRLGDRSSTLVELIVDPASSLLRGVTLTSFDLFRPWPTLGRTIASDGLPVLATQWDQSDRSLLAVDINRDFDVSMLGNQLLISWGDLADLSGSSVHGRAHFLFAGNELAGIRFFDLSETEAALLTSHAQGRIE